MNSIENLHNDYSSIFKMVYGFRPRFASDKLLNSVSGLEKAISLLADELTIVLSEEETQMQIKIAEFEVFIHQVISAGAKNRETAIRWITDGSNDLEYFCYEYGLPIDYLTKGKS